MTSDPEHSETPEGMAEEAKAFEDGEDAFIARNREAIGRMVEEARASLARGEGREWNLQEFLEEAHRRHASASDG